MNEPSAMPPNSTRLEVLRAQLLRLMADGQLTDQELQQLQRTRDSLGLTPAEVRSLRAEIYNNALKQAEQDGTISEREAELLNRIVQFLNGSAWLNEHLKDPLE